MGHGFPVRQDHVRRNDRLGKRWLQVYLRLSGASADFLEVSSSRALGLILVASIVGVTIQFLLQYKGLEATTVSHASLIVGTLPILVALFSSLLLKEKLKAFEYGLMVTSAGGPH